MSAGGDASERPAGEDKAGSWAHSSSSAKCLFQESGYLVKAFLANLGYHRIVGWIANYQ